MVPVREPTGLATVPVWVWVGGLVALSVAIRLVYALRDPGPWIFHDEIAYSELAKSIADTGSFAIREEVGRAGFGVVYPLLIAPAFVLFDRVPDAYDALRTINVVLMSMTAVPVYLLARRLTGRGLGLAAAALSVAIPSFMYTSNVMTENAFYPLFGTWVLALQLMLVRPTVLRQLAVLGLFGVCFLTRAQAVTLLPALVGATALTVVLDAWAESRRPVSRRLVRRLGDYWLTWALLSVALVGVIGTQLVRGRRISDVLGSYAGVSEFDYDFSDIARWLLYHVAELDIYVGVIPFAALLIVLLTTLRPEAGREVRIFAAVSLSAVASFLVVVSVYASTPVALRIEERNLFYVAPLFFIAFVVWLGRGLPRPWPAALPAAIAAGLLPAAIPYNDFLNDTATHSAPGLLQILRFRERYFSPETITEVVVLAAVAAALLFLLVPRRLGIAALAMVFLYYVAINRPVEAYTHKASSEAVYGGIRRETDWIDRTVGKDADVAGLWGGGNPVILWENEFFNRSVGPIYSLVGAFDGLPEIQLSIDQKGVVRDLDGLRPRVDYLLASKWIFVRGRQVAADKGAGMSLYRVDGPMVVLGRAEGIYPDTWSGPSVRYLRYGCRGGRVTVRLTNDPVLRSRPVTVTAVVNGEQRARVRVPRTAVGYPFSVRLSPVGGVCEAFFNVAPTAVPAIVLGTGDGRDLGIRIAAINYQP
jgi:dolichyl-phosphate-mannose-protein mannosyltransferase